MVEPPSDIQRDQRNGQTDTDTDTITTTDPSSASTNTTAYDANDLHQLCRQLNARITAFLEQDAPTDRLKRVQQQTRISLGVVEDALRRYRCVVVPPIITPGSESDKALTVNLSCYRLDELSLSYNGGKDCLVLLIIFLAALARHFPSPAPSKSQDASPGIQSVYIVSPHPFAEVDSFVAESTTTYNLDLSRYSKPMKTAFAEYLQERPHVKAIFVGTRRTDPHGADLTFFDPTDHGWPNFMRVHPVIDWHYAEIWAGYTSLGGKTDTHPNPALRALPSRHSGLRASSSSGENNQEDKAFSFRPAYELVDDEEERLGRDG
ncbi:MAG: hypothetical protein M1819_005959 [Sarea resinae]|nr:MAG: hypothetical protein M1819_005959 [Sarea resinae]